LIIAFFSSARTSESLSTPCERHAIRSDDSDDEPTKARRVIERAAWARMMARGDVARGRL
jgi:hypothetical protein